MREHKYKAFFDNKMWDVWKIEWSGDKVIAVSIKRSPYLEYWFASSNDPIKIVQFTGLKDMDNNEIYEGDILTLNFGIPPKLAHMKVEWFHGGFEINCWDSSPAICPIGDLYDQLDSISVIGNIYENPELLEIADKARGDV